MRTIEQALLLAYHRTEGAQPHARVELDRKSGHVVVWAQEHDARRARSASVDDTPEGFGRIAATTARQAILQRLRDVEDEQVLGEFRGREGDIVAGVVQQSSDPRMVHVDLGTVEGVLPPQEQVPGERYTHGSRLRCYVVGRPQGPEGPVDHALPDPPEPRAQAVRPGGARGRRRHASRSWRWPARRATARRSPSGRP